jgi:short-subunit dehydrogenase
MKTTLITGASGGIGEAIAKRLVEKKENLTLVARNETKLRHLGQELSHMSISVEGLPEIQWALVGLALK